MDENKKVHKNHPSKLIDRFRFGNDKFHGRNIFFFFFFLRDMVESSFDDSIVNCMAHALVLL